MDLSILPSDINPSIIEPYINPNYTIPGTERIPGTIRPFYDRDEIPDPNNNENKFPDYQFGICYENEF